MDKKFISLLYLIISNVLVLLIGIVSAFIVPRFITIDEFGYWQLFLLYSSYVGLMLFGYCDGIYLIHGGREKKKLDKRDFSSYFLILVVYSIAISILALIIVSIIDITTEYKILLNGIISIFLLQGINSYFILINQATGKFKLYSILNLLEKLLLAIFIIVMIIFDNINYNYLVSFAIVSKVIILFINIITSKEIVFNKPSFSKRIVNEVLTFIQIGLPLTLYGVVSMLMTGVGKLSVERNFDIGTFGVYAFAFSSMTIIVQIIISISLVLYPFLANTSDVNIRKVVKTAEQYSLTILVIVFASFYALYLIIIKFLPNYNDSIKILVILFPMLLFQAKISSVYGVALKVKKKTKVMLGNAIMVLIMLVVAAILGTILNLKSEYFACITVFGYFLWYIFNMRSYNIIYNDKVRINIMELVFIIVFFATNLLYLHIVSLIIFSLISLLFVIRLIKANTLFISEKLKGFFIKTRDS